MVAVDAVAELAADVGEEEERCRRAAAAEVAEAAAATRLRTTAAAAPAAAGTDADAAVDDADRDQRSGRAIVEVALVVAGSILRVAYCI